MRRTNAPKLLLLTFSVVLMITWVPKNAEAAIRGPASVELAPGLGRKAVEALKNVKPKTFAVFVVSSNLTDVIGGVAGTAFFTSESDAITAYHVLQPKSFEVPDGYSHRQVWLVHENHPPIELRQEDVQFDAANDRTRIHVGQKISTQFVYQSIQTTTAGQRVSTDGFVANSVGPVLARAPRGLKVLSVPHLDRVHLEGEIVNRSRVDLRAADVTLKNTPCLQVTLPPIRGISGGPLLVDGRAVGVNSFGDPRAQLRTWAVELALSGS